MDTQLTSVHEDSIHVEESPEKNRSMSTFDVQVGGKEAESDGRNVARMYVPTLQERVHTAMLGPFGLGLEIVNFILSMLIFLAYIAELYDADIYYSHSRLAVEAFATTFFIFDFALHLFVASDPWRYVFTAHGVIDLVTIIPSLVMFIDPNSRSSLMFVFRVLRICRALRVLRLAHYVQLKKHSFEYELGGFIVSAIAVILCAAGIFQALEVNQHDEPDKLQFHDALYFVLVTISTIGYGDITPRTVLGQVFVILVIIGIFTTVPAEVNKLNMLAKQNNSWDKDVAVKSTGHVIVSGYNVTATIVLEFLQEFYHPSRGTIHLDVVFVSDDPPSSEIIAILKKRKYRQRTTYMRGSLMVGRDQLRAKMKSATAVFFLANNRHEPAQQDAATILHAVSIRNYGDSCGKHTDVYIQLLSRVNDYEMASELLDANATKTSALKDMLLARASVCPGSSTLILNLIRSYYIGQYIKRPTWRKKWIREYLDGMTYQVFPIMFSNRFHRRKFDVVARHMYEKYCVLLVSALSTKENWNAGSSCDTTPVNPIQLVPFGSRIREGDIGFVIAKSASDVMGIVNSYGYWDDSSGGGRRQSENLLSPTVRVSSDTLWRRRSQSAAAVRNIRSEITADRAAYNRWGEPEENTNHVNVGTTAIHPSNSSPTTEKADKTPSRINRPQLTLYVTNPPSGTQLYAATTTKDEQKVEAVFERDHFRSNVKGQSGHYVICSRSLSDAVSIAKFLRVYSRREYERSASGNDQDRFPGFVHIVLLMSRKPTGKDLIRAAADSPDFLRSIIVVVGSPARSTDLMRVEATKARQIVILPLDKNVPTEGDHQQEFGPNSRNTWADDERLADFGIICSLLAVEITKQGLSTSTSPRNRRRQSSWLGSDIGTPTSNTSFRRELEQGLPLESVKLRAMERFPHLDPGVFRENPNIIETALQEQYDHQVILAAEQKGMPSSVWQSSPTGNILAVLHYASNAKFCRPCDEDVQDELPSLTPLFAGGGIFLSSLLNRIVCQAFYNPYATDVIEALANGSSPSMSPSPHGPRAPDNQHRRLFDVELEEKYVDREFLAVFLDFIAKDMLVIGVLRHPSHELENVMPFVYTCPNPTTRMHMKDRLFVGREVASEVVEGPRINGKRLGEALGEAASTGQLKQVENILFYGDVTRSPNNVASNIQDKAMET